MSSGFCGELRQLQAEFGCVSSQQPSHCGLCSATSQCLLPACGGAGPAGLGPAASFQCGAPGRACIYRAPGGGGAPVWEGQAGTSGTPCPESLGSAPLWEQADLKCGTAANVSAFIKAYIGHKI